MFLVAPNTKNIFQKRWPKKSGLRFNDIAYFEQQRKNRTKTKKVIQHHKESKEIQPYLINKFLYNLLRYDSYFSLWVVSFNLFILNMINIFLRLYLVEL